MRFMICSLPGKMFVFHVQYSHCLLSMTVVWCPFPLSASISCLILVLILCSLRHLSFPFGRMTQGKSSSPISLVCLSHLLRSSIRYMRMDDFLRACFDH